MNTTRVDRWLWAVRLYRTRTAATEACGAGHVRVNDAPAKASTKVGIGDRVEARIHQRDRIVDVVRVIEKRVGASVAAECLVDHSPPEPDRSYEPPVFRRDPGAGRPTKADRRALDRHRGR